MQQVRCHNGKSTESSKSRGGPGSEIRALDVRIARDLPAHLAIFIAPPATPRISDGDHRIGETLAQTKTPRLSPSWAFFVANITDFGVHRADSSMTTQDSFQHQNSLRDIFTGPGNNPLTQRRPDRNQVIGLATLFLRMAALSSDRRDED
jgi:hypothetical protein